MASQEELADALLGRGFFSPGDEAEKLARLLGVEKDIFRRMK